MKILFLIPARGASKGIPGKNIKTFLNKPLICHTLDVARHLATESDICVSTDDDEIIKAVEAYGHKVSFKRPKELSTDASGSYEVIMHALSYFESIGVFYDCLVLLQPTSPFRKSIHVEEAFKIYSSDLDMVVSVKEANTNPYFGLYEENSNGLLEKSKTGNYSRRQDCPKAWQFNGAIYIMNIDSLKHSHFSEFKNIRKYEMNEFDSIDLDTMLDWEWANFLLQKGFISLGD